MNPYSEIPIVEIEAFGINEYGLADMAGNVWEWTDTCYRRVALDGGAASGRVTMNCGVRVVAGRDRSYMTDFIRDPRSGVAPSACLLLF